MNKTMIRAGAALIALALAQPATAAPATIEALRDAALKDDTAWELTEGLTTEVGQRLAGTDAEARARTWAVARLKALGFSNVRIEPFDMPVWVRGAETAEIVAPFPQKLAITALGNSGATPPAGLTAPVVGFASLDALIAADPTSVRGRIVFVTHRMGPTQDGSSYGPFGDVRRAGPSVAAKMGAAAIVIRSIGTDHHRNPHTGVQSWAAGATPIPAGALSVPDAEQLERILKRGKPVTMRLVLTPQMTGIHQSGNVIAEVPGRDPKAGIVLVGGHLDSWDLGTGAIDDAAGVAITAAAAKRVGDAGKPLRTIRVVWFGAEEVGGFGGIAYAKRHAAEKHVVVAESDFGADRVWRFDTRFANPAAPTAAAIATALLPLGIARGGNAAHGGTDVEPTAALGVPIIDLRQDGTRYFDLHHTPDDTLDKVDPEQLRQNVAAWTAMLSVVANTREEFGPIKAEAE
jgi:carboxypeptidase Q